jgi:hypothetical protein
MMRCAMMALQTAREYYYGRGASSLVGFDAGRLRVRLACCKLAGADRRLGRWRGVSTVDSWIRDGRGVQKNDWSELVIMGGIVVASA